MKLQYTSFSILFFALLFIVSSCGKDPSCSDGKQNQGELGVDCCGPCAPCLNQPDCDFTVITTNTCFDGIQNGDETGIDCGGSCLLPCEIIVEESCTDGIQNGDETGIDCGGSCPNECVVVEPPVTGTFVQAQADGTLTVFSEADISAILTNGVLAVSASKVGLNGLETMTFSIPETSLTVGGYPLSDGATLTEPYITYFASGTNDACISVTGSMNILIADSTAQTISGTFQFDCSTTDGTTASITNGEFSEITW